MNQDKHLDAMLRASLAAGLDATGARLSRRGSARRVCREHARARRAREMEIALRRMRGYASASLPQSRERMRSAPRVRVRA